MAIKKYTNGSWAPASYRKYGAETDIITTLPATIIGDGTPISSYTIKGNMEQTGTPTPENPIMSEGVGERTENVMPSAPAETKSSNGVTITCDGNGVYTLSGTALSGTYIVFRFKDFTIPISVGQGGQGTMSLFNTIPSTQVGMTFLNGSTTIDSWSINSANRKSNSYVTMSGAVCNAIQFYAPAGGNCDCVIKPCFTNDSIYPASYIPYGYKLPMTVSDGNTVQTVPVYLGEVETTRRIKKLVLTGKEDLTWGKSSTRPYSWYIYNQGINGLTGMKFFCTHGATVTRPSDYVYGTVYADNTYNLGIFPSLNNADEVNSWLAAQYAAGTPVTVWYVLAEPETGIVNEPICKIGDYADSVSGTNLATSGTAQEFDIGTTLKPSEVDLTYHGWHKHDDTKYIT